MKIPNKLPSDRQAYAWNARLKKSEYKDRRMTFGQYTNVKISELPDDYLEWACATMEHSDVEYLLKEWKSRNPTWRTMIKKMNK